MLVYKSSKVFDNPINKASLFLFLKEDTKTILLIIGSIQLSLNCSRYMKLFFKIRSAYVSKVKKNVQKDEQYLGTLDHLVILKTITEERCNSKSIFFFVEFIKLFHIVPRTNLLNILEKD